MKWPWREHEVARRRHILFLLVMFGVFAFLLALAQVMFTSHRLGFIYLFRSYICVFTLCCVPVGLMLGMVHWLQKVFFSARWTRSEIVQLRVKTYSLRPPCAPSLTLISGYRHAWSRSSVQVVYIVIELSTSRGREGSLCWMTSCNISVEWYKNRDPISK